MSRSPQVTALPATVQTVTGPEEVYLARCKDMAAVEYLERESAVAHDAVTRLKAKLLCQQQHVQDTELAIVHAVNTAFVASKQLKAAQDAVAGGN